MAKQAIEDTVICLSFYRDSASEVLQSLLGSRVADFQDEDAEALRPTYTKNRLNPKQFDEHMYSVTTTDEMLAMTDLSPELRKEIQDIRKRCDKQGAAYFRLID